MRWLSSLVVGFVLLLPAPAPARGQAAKLQVADLVGTWKMDASDLVLTIRPDSTFRFTGEPGGKNEWRYGYYKGYDFRKDTTFQHWKSLKGDTISFGHEDGPCAAGVNPCIRRVPYQIKVIGKLLEMRPLGVSAPMGVEEGRYFQPFAAPTPQTLKLVADLVGKWEGTWQGVGFLAKAEACSLAFRPDSMFSLCGNPFSSWSYLVGDTLSLWGNEGGFKVTLKDQQLTLTNVSNDDRYKNVSGTFQRADTLKKP